MRSEQHLRSLGKVGEYYSLDGFLNNISSAFNTIQPHHLVQKLLNMNLSSSIVHCIFKSLTNRPHVVSLKGATSDAVCSNSGTPQGTVLAPFLFTLYTTDCGHTGNTCLMIKFADDSEMIGKITNDDDSVCIEEINSFVKWCDDNY